jgi:hypothetical protein
MYVKVKHRLSGRKSIRLDDVHALRVERIPHLSRGR